MKYTFGYFLKKPDREEFYNVAIHNENMDKIDEAIGVLEANKASKTDLSATNNRVTNLENGKASKNGSSSENFVANNITANEATVNGGTVYHTGRKPNKTDVGLGNVDNYPSSNIYATLDGTGAKFVLQSAIKSFYDSFVALVTRVTNVESGKASINGDSTKDFSARNIVANEATISGGTVYHTGRKPTKADVGLGNVDNYPSSNIYATLDGTGAKFVLQSAIKSFYDSFLQLVSRVTNVESGKANLNGDNTKDFSAKNIVATEVTVNGGTVYHTGRKPTKADVGLGNVDNYPSSNIYTTLDGTGAKFVLQSAIKSFYDSFSILVTRVTNVETGKANLNGDNTKDFSAKNIIVTEATVNGGTVYHTGRKPTKTDIGLGNVDNYPSSNLYMTLDGTGDKFVLQKTIKAMFDDLIVDIDNVSIIGEPILTLCDTLPNTTDFGWMDGGQLKKSDYPKLWARVEATVNLAVQKVTAGTMQYGVSYFGWYIGDTSEYFRKPNMNGTGHIIRPSSSRFVGVYEADENKEHTHTGTTSVNGDHVHTMWSETEGTAGGGRTMSYRSKMYSSTLPMDSAGSHSHTLTILSSGGSEVRMKNIAGKYYCRLK